MNKILLIASLLLTAYSGAHAAGGTFSRDPASAADDLAADTVSADEKPSDYKSAVQVMTQNLKPFQACFNSEVQKHPGLSAHVTVQWNVNPNGDPVGVRLSKSDIHAASFDACMRREMMKLRFAPPSPKTAQPYAYPFVFYSDKTEKTY